MLAQTMVRPQTISAMPKVVILTRLRPHTRPLSGPPRYHGLARYKATSHVGQYGGSTN